MKKKIIIIGKNSFIGSNINIYLQNKFKVININLNQFKKLKKNQLKKFDYICNCSVNKKYIHNKYNTKNDIDLQIANIIKNNKINYIFLSSRKIYKPKFNTNEKQNPNPIDIYSHNKVITEKTLKKILGSKLLILRISNVIGFKIRKNKRQVNKTFFDNYIESVKNKSEVNYYNLFKDFISIEQLADYFYYAINKRLTGKFNVSLGKKIYVKEILGWLNKYNKNKKNFICLKTPKTLINKTSFTLNNNKIYKLIKYRPSKNELKKFCVNISKSIH
ncbi:NAD-dependent epimerase/dehydratase family protein [Candidatus Pelagibacter sp.]|uniref:NAD-dependent epimerase/dehydratase family protein n=1 Tax=Candidatus Pelagibacter sp. TaxID=2024849 RepID=UPI003F852EFA